MMSIAIGNLAGGDADGIGTAARLSSPGAMAVHPDGSLYIVDVGNHTIRRYDPTTGAVTTLLTDALISVQSPSLAIAANGDLYYTIVFDGSHHQIKRVPSGSSVGTVICGATSGSTHPYPDTALTHAFTISGLTVSLDQRTLYVTSFQVQVLDLVSGIISHYAGGGQDMESDGTLRGRPDYFDATLNANRLTASFTDASACWVGPDGSIVVLSRVWSYLSTINTDGSVTRITQCGSGYPVGDTGTVLNSGHYRGDGGPAFFEDHPGGFDYFGPLGGGPQSIDVSACFDLCITQPSERVVRTIGADGILHTLAGAQRDNVWPTPVYPALTLAEGETVPANSKTLPANPLCCRAIPRAQGGGVWVSCGNCILKIQ